MDIVSDSMKDFISSVFAQTLDRGDSVRFIIPCLSVIRIGIYGRFVSSTSAYGDVRVG